jgi:hypothetical protein
VVFRRNRPLTPLAGALAAAVTLLSGGNARAQTCASPRPFTDGEVTFLREGREALLALVPEPPSGWVRQSVTNTATAGPLCEDPGYKPPLFVRVHATYLPLGAPERTLEKRAADSAAYEARVAAAAREEADAAKSGDAARLERARKASRDLKAHPVPTPPAVPPRSTQRLEVRLQVNPTSYPSCARSEPVEVEGAASAYRARATTCRDRTPGDVYLVAFGAWKAKPTPAGAFLAGFNEWPAPPLDRAKAYTALAELAGDADAVDAVLRSFDPSRLRAILTR